MIDIGTSFLQSLKGLRMWKQGGKRAPNKPLLLLMALARVSRGEARLASYAEVAPHLARLLREFGPYRDAIHPEYPFWRLANDGLWEVHWGRIDRVRDRAGRDPGHRELLEGEVAAGFPPNIHDALRQNPDLIRKAAQYLLQEHFQESYYEDLIQDVGLALPPAGRWTFQVARDPAFRASVLAAYAERCAVCGFDLRLGSSSVGLDAAHIRWKQASGPDHETNGLALCTLHHRLFDRGAFTVSPEYRVLVSEQIVGEALGSTLLRHHREPVRAPALLSSQQPLREHLIWHREQVFKEPARGG